MKGPLTGRSVQNPTPRSFRPIETVGESIIIEPLGFDVLVEHLVTGEDHTRKAEAGEDGCPRQSSEKCMLDGHGMLPGSNREMQSPKKRSGKTPKIRDQGSCYDELRCILGAHAVPYS